jgi:hypothetical protein
MCGGGAPPSNRVEDEYEWAWGRLVVDDVVV